MAIVWVLGTHEYRMHLTVSNGCMVFRILTILSRDMAYICNKVQFYRYSPPPSNFQEKNRFFSKALFETFQTALVYYPMDHDSVFLELNIAYGSVELCTILSQDLLTRGVDVWVEERGIKLAFWGAGGEIVFEEHSQFIGAAFPQRRLFP